MTDGDNMFIDAIKDKGKDQLSKTFMHQMAKVYQENLPDTLYLNHYELSEQFGFTPKQWDEFLKIDKVDRIIESEIAQIAEIGARQALQRLQNEGATSQDIQAARELLNNSKLIQQKTNIKPQIIITRMPSKHEQEV